MKRIKTIAVICLLSIIGIKLYAASITIFPADLRQDKSIYCIGNEINPIHFILFSDRACGGKPGRYLLKDFNEDIESAQISFSVDIPSELKYLGIVDMLDIEFDSENKTEQVNIDGKEYTRHTISLKRDIIISRVVKGRRRYDINLWLHIPEQYQGEIRWRLLKNGKPLVTAQASIKTVGTLNGMTAGNSENFKFFLTYPEPNLPVEIIDRRIALYKKMGVTDVTFNYTESRFTEYRIAYIKKLKAAGIKTNLQRGGSFSSERRLLRKALSGKNSQGLYSAAQQCYTAITNDTNKNMLSAKKWYMDGFILDYEQHGAITHPAYGDTETVAAFAEAEGLDGIPTVAELKGKYHTKYTIEAVSANDENGFKKVIKQTESIKSLPKDNETTKNNDSEMLILPLDFTFNNSDSMPDGYSIFNNRLDGTISKDDKVFAGESGPSLCFHCPENGRIGITTGKERRLKLETDKKYILTFQFKIENMTTFGKWSSGFIFYLLGASKSYSWIGSSGNGSTNAWVTAVMPFDTGKKPAMAKPYIRILCNNISGTVWLQNASIIEMTDETVPKNRYFILGDGTQINASILKL